MKGNLQLSAELQWIVLDASRYVRPLFGLLFLISIPFTFSYLFTLATFLWTQTFKTINEVPAEIPTFLPALSNTIRFLLNPKSFVKAFTSYSASAVIQVSLLGRQVFFVSGRQGIRDLWRSPSFSGPSFMGSPVLKRLLGLSDEEDGNHAPGHTQTRSKFDSEFHKLVRQKCSAEALTSAFSRFTRIYEASIFEARSDDWVKRPDLAAFFRQHIGCGILQALFGLDFLESDPTFVEDLWKFYDVSPSLAAGLPYLLAPRAHRLRSRLVSQIRRWLVEEEDHDVESSQDLDATATAYLGFIWASITNTVPMALMATMHIFEEKDLLHRVRGDIKGRGRSTECSSDLLRSIYAETLRMYTQSLITRRSSSNTSISDWCIPRGEVAVVSTHDAHMDTSIWGNMNDLHPANEFWAERFLQGGRYSTAGFRGSWIPYGGGQGACPGQALAQKVILHTCATITTDFDVEILTESWGMSNAKFGLGAQMPKEKIRFQIRHRPRSV